MRGREVLLLQGLDQVWAVLGVHAPQGTFSTGLLDKTDSQQVSQKSMEEKQKPTSQGSYFSIMFPGGTVTNLESGLVSLMDNRQK